VTDILALDIATALGFARGSLGGVPTCSTIKFNGPDGASDAAVFANCLRWLSDFLAPMPRPDILVLEAMLPIEAMQGETNRATRDRLAGLHGVIKGVAHCRGVYDIRLVNVQQVRKHFCGDRFAKKDQVRERCRELGWPTTDHNAADAAACWDYVCSLLDPRIGIMRSPLFRARGIEFS
jgi:hypothetical protein